MIITKFIEGVLKERMKLREIEAKERENQLSKTSSQVRLVSSNRHDRFDFDEKIEKHSFFFQSVVVNFAQE